jgi:organic hydroperoxide reductase OsmC/OhrA
VGERQVEHRVEVEWTGRRSTRVIVQGRPVIRTGTPPDAGEGVMYHTPEELFVAAGAVCFMNSFVYFTQKMRLEFKDMKVEAVGYLEQVGNSYEVTRIHVKTHLMVGSDERRGKFERALELGAKYCFIANSMKCPTTHEHEIVVG